MTGFRAFLDLTLLFYTGRCRVPSMAMPLDAFYLKILGVDPQQHHLDFFESGARGYNTRAIEDDKVVTVLVKALYMTMGTKTAIVIATPRSLEKQTLQEISNHARRIVRRFKGKDRQVKRIVTAIKRLRIASRLLSDQPALWVSIGYCEEDPVPQWLREKLWTMTTT
jgi:hypothetical protein